MEFEPKERELGFVFKKNRSILFLIFFLILLSGCSKNNYETDIEINKEMTKIIKSDEEAVNTRNVDLALSNYATKILTNEIKQLQKESFENYKRLGITLNTSDIKVIYVKDNEAIIKCLNKYRTPKFDENNNFQNDNYMLHFMIKENEKWKFNFSYIEKRIFVKKNGELDLRNEEFSGWDETKFWDETIKEMKKQNILPTEYLKENPI